LNNNTITTKVNHFLYPSALFASKEPYLVTTILGSCVAVCFWDKIKKVGGINHYMLPLWNGQGLASPKYGNIAINKLHEKMLQLGSTKENLQAKIFGGGEVIETTVYQYSIGQRNIEIAENTLRELNINIVASSIGGKKGRKILFDTSTGEVRLKFINSSQ